MLHQTPYKCLLAILATGALTLATARAAIAPATDLAIGQTAFPNPVMQGQPLTYSLVVSNLGTFLTASNVVVRDFLPAGTVFSNATPPGVVDPVKQSLTVNLGSLGPGAVAALTVVVVPTNAGVLVNLATVSADTADPFPANNSASATNTVTGAGPLVLNCSSNIAVQAAGSTGTVVFFTVTASSACPPVSVQAVPPSGSLFPVGSNLVIVTASDGCGNTNNCSFMVTVLAPMLSLTCPTNFTVAATETNGAVVFFSASATGGCPPVSVQAMPPSGSQFPIGTTPVSVTATDGCGNTATCGFQVTVVAPPVSIVCPSDITTTAADPGGAVVTYDVQAIGGCLPLNIVTVPASGHLFPVGSTTVIATVSDACGSSTNCSFAVIVGPPPGAPVIVSQPQSQVVPPGTDVLLSVSVTGNSPLAFQWRLEGVPIQGATGSTLFRPAVTWAWEGVYDVTVSNLVDYFTSDPAYVIVQETNVTVSVLAGAGGGVFPSGVVITNAGSDVMLTALPDAGYEVNHWFVNGEAVQDGGNSFILDAVSYDLSVSNSFRPTAPMPIPVTLSARLVPNPLQLVLTATGPPSDLGTLDESLDLTNWVPVTTLSNYNGQAQYIMPLGPGYGSPSNLFFRVSTSKPWPTFGFVGGSPEDSSASGALVIPQDLTIPVFSWMSADSFLGETAGEGIQATVWQVIRDYTGVPQAIEFAGQVQNAIIQGAIQLSNNINQATIYVTRTVQGVQRQVIYTLSLLNCKILADSNRDGVVDDNDNTNKTIFTTGPNGWGATILVNCDDDDGDHVPDNWPGGSINGVNVPADDHVNGAGDLLDIGQVMLQRTGVPLANLPANFQVRLQVTLPRTPAGLPMTEPEYFTNLVGGDVMPPERRVRVFLPTQVQGQDLVLGPADREILGPSQGDTAVFLQNPAAAGPPPPAQYNYSILAGNGRVFFGIEGIEFAAAVDVRVQYFFGAMQLCSDRVRVKTAPFLLMANNNPVSSTIVSSQAAGAANNGAFTAAFDAADNVPTTIIPSATSANDVWAQDEWEIGFQMVPGPGVVRTRTVVLDLPRNRGLGPYAIRNILAPSVCVFEGIKGTGQGSVLTYGGNIECSGPVQVTKAGTRFDYRLGRIIVGDTALNRPDGAALPRTLRNFLFAQGVQDPIVIETGWLGVGHVDEVIGLVPDASGADVRNFRMVIGSAAEGARVLNAIPVGDNGVHISNGNGTPWEMTVGEFKGDTRGIRSINTIIQNRYITPIRNQLQRELNITLTEVPALYYTPANTDPKADDDNDGTATLRRVNVTIANTPFDVTFWVLVFSPDPAGGVRFQVRYQRAFVGDPFTTAAGFGNTGADFDTGQGVVVPSAAWANAAGARRGDVFYWYTAKPANVFQVGAWFPGLQNAQVANNRVLAPDPQGPLIAGRDVLKDDYEAALAGLGLNFNYPAPASEFRWYHRRHGEVHCGSNRFSSPYPQAANYWWAQPPPTAAGP